MSSARYEARDHPHGHWTMTFLAALRHDRVDAPWLLDGPIDGESFKTYVEKVLVSTLKPGDIVAVDNLGSHKAIRPIQPFLEFFAAGFEKRLLPPDTECEIARRRLKSHG